MWQIGNEQNEFKGENTSHKIGKGQITHCNPLFQAVQRTWHILPKVRMERVGKGAQGLLKGQRAALEAPRPAVIQVIPCSNANIDEPDEESRPNGPSSRETRQREEEDRRDRKTGVSRGSSLLSPKTVPIIMTSTFSDAMDEEGDNISVYSRIMSARSNPGTPRGTRKGSRKGSGRRSECRNSISSDEEDNSDSVSRISLEDDRLQPHQQTLNVPPPKFTRVFSVGGELNSIFNKNSTSSKSTTKFSRSISRWNHAPSPSTRYSSRPGQK